MCVCGIEEEFHNGLRETVLQSECEVLNPVIMWHHLHPPYGMLSIGSLGWGILGYGLESRFLAKY